MGGDFPFWFPDRKKEFGRVCSTPLAAVDFCHVLGLIIVIDYRV